MEKEKLSSDLKSAVGTTSMSDQSWNAYVDNVAFPYFPEDETKQADYLAKHVAYLKTQSGQYNKDIADRVKNQVLPNSEPLKAEQPADYEPQWAKDLKKQMADLEKAKADEITSIKAKERIALVSSKVKELGADNPTILDLVVKSTSVKDGTSDDDYVNQVKAEYDKQYSAIYGDGARPAFGGGNQIKISGKVSPEVQKVKDKMAEERKKLQV